MEIPRSIPLGAEGRKSQHKFLPLFSSVERGSTSGYLRTHDFLRPLEEEGGRNADQRRAPASEAIEETSQCSSFTSSGFTLFDESTSANTENGHHRIPQPYFNSISSSLLDNRSFLNGWHREDVHSIKKETVSSSENKLEFAAAKMKRRSHDPKLNTPRSKHSATEQRRRSKINERFITLRDLVPHGDQKRDKASFLLEVIEYIQILQEKLRKHELHELSYEDRVGAATPLQESSSGDPPEKMAVEGGTISISSAYSQGLLSSLTLALQKSGVDLSQASISVQVNLGKRANGKDMAVSGVPISPSLPKRLKPPARK